MAMIKAEQTFFELWAQPIGAVELFRRFFGQGSEPLRAIRTAFALKDLFSSTPFSTQGASQRADIPMGCMACLF
jgi:hypothetical protein